MSPDSEICHSFVFRLLIANRNFTGDYPDPLESISSIEAKRLFFPDTGISARAGGEFRLEKTR